MTDINQADLEEVGQIHDTVDSLLHATLLPLPPQAHLDMLTEGFKDVRSRLRAVYQELGGDDVWEDQPPSAI